MFSSYFLRNNLIVYLLLMGFFFRNENFANFLVNLLKLERIRKDIFLFPKCLKSFGVD